MHNKVNSRVLEITTNVGCRIMCSYCPQATFIRAFKSNNSLKEFGVLTRENLNRYLESVPTLVDIHFSGYSEPFHNDECVEMIKDVNLRGHKIAVFTTGDGLDIDRASDMSSIDFKRFMLHVPDRHGLMNLEVNSNYILKLKKILSLFGDKIEFYSLGDPHPLITQEFGVIAASDRVTSRADNLPKDVSVNVQNYLKIRASSKEKVEKPIICRRHRILSNVMLPNGDVQLCCMDYGLKEKLGNLMSQTYAQIVGARELSKLIMRMSDSNKSILCDSCEYAQPGSYSGSTAQSA